MSEMKTILQGAQEIIDSNENMIMNVEGENKYNEKEILKSKKDQ